MIKFTHFNCPEFNGCDFGDVFVMDAYGITVRMFNASPNCPYEYIDMNGNHLGRVGSDDMVVFYMMSPSFTDITKTLRRVGMNVGTGNSCGRTSVLCVIPSDEINPSSVSDALAIMARIRFMSHEDGNMDFMTPFLDTLTTIDDRVKKYVKHHLEANHLDNSLEFFTNLVDYGRIGSSTTLVFRNDLAAFYQDLVHCIGYDNMSPDVMLARSVNRTYNGRTWISKFVNEMVRIMEDIGVSIKDCDDIDRDVRGCTHVCINCGAKVDNVNSDGLCPDCEGDYFIDSYDGSIASISDMINGPDGRRYSCTRNAEYDGCFVCACCGDAYPTSESIYSEDGEICNDCYDEHYFTCSDCDNVYRLSRRADEDDNICESCAEERENRGHYDDSDDSIPSPSCVREYHYGRGERMYREKYHATNERGPYLTLGFELEFEPPEDATEDDVDYEDIDAIYDRYDSYIHFEHDGSLNDGGAEMISVPATLKYHESTDLKGILERISNDGYRSHDTSDCGLHVHMGRDFFTSKLQLAKMDIVINNASDFWQKIARRRSSSYSSYVHKDSMNIINEDERYTAVNFCNSSTVEIRIARGSLNYNTVMGTMEIYDALARECRYSRFGIGSILCDPYLIVARVVGRLSDKKSYPKQFGMEYLQARHIDIDGYLLKNAEITRSHLKNKHGLVKGHK